MRTNRSIFVNHAARLAAFGFANCLAVSAMAAGTPAGVLIENTAEASFDADSGRVAVASNTVAIRVDEVLSATVTSLDAGTITAGPGPRALAFAITNTGNGPESFTLAADPARPGNDFDMSVTGIAVDTNGNGVYDEGTDQLLSDPATTPPLAADASLTVFFLVSVPTGAGDTGRSEITVTAQTTTGSGAAGTVIAGAGEDGSDAVIGAGGGSASVTAVVTAAVASVELVKSAIVQNSFGGTAATPGSTITYTLRADVTGTGEVAGLTITDAIPTGTQYLPATLTLDGASLTDAGDSDAGEASAAGILVALGTVTAGTSRTITFDVMIDQ